MKKILSLDLGITSIGYSIIDELGNNNFSLINYGVFMLDTPYSNDEKRISKKTIHSQVIAIKKLYKLKKERKQNLAKLFEEYNFGRKDDFLNQEKKNLFINKWELRAKKAFNEKLSFQEFFSILYLIAKHRGYKSLDTDDLLEEFCEKLGLNQEVKKEKTVDERGKIKQALKTIETLKLQFPHKTIPQIIYEVEIQKDNPTFRNHDNYNYMIRREYINEEIKTLVLSQEKFGLFDKNFDSKAFIEKLIKTIDDQKESSNDLSLFGNCEYFKNEKVAHQYSLLADIYKMYQSIANITFNSNPTIKISKDQIKLIANDFFDKLKNGKNITDIKYKEVRKILKLSDDFKIFNKEDSYKSKDKTQENSITKFHFVNNLSKFDKDFIKNILEKSNKYEILKEIFDVLRDEKQPKPIYDKLNTIFLKYDLINDKSTKNNTILELIKNKTGSSLSISHQAMINIIPYFEDGFTIDEIKQKLNLNREEDYLSFKKGIKYLSVAQFENDTNLLVNNHPVKYVVSAVFRLIKHLHTTYGAFDEIRVVSNEELQLNQKAIKNIHKKKIEKDKKTKAILENINYQQIANSFDKNIEDYVKRILLWEEQNGIDIYTGKIINIEDIFSKNVDITYIIPKSLGGLNSNHNLVLVYINKDNKISNQLPINYILDKQEFINRIEYLFNEYKISWKKRRNLLTTNLDEIYENSFKIENKIASSYIEFLTSDILKRYYPFNSHINVTHSQIKIILNIRKFLNIKSKIPNTNIYHAINAILMGISDKVWMQKLCNTFKNNLGLKENLSEQNIKRFNPFIQGIEVKKFMEMIEYNYNSFGEESIFYKDIFGKLKVVKFWVSKKALVSKIHVNNIYSKKPDGYFTARGIKNINEHFIELKISPNTKAEDFYEKFKNNILEKMYVYKTNPNDIICKIVKDRAYEIKNLLISFEYINKNDSDIYIKAQQQLNNLICSPILDNNNKPIRKVKFYRTNLTGFNVRGGLATKEKTFIGFKVKLDNYKLVYERIDLSNYEIIKTQKDNSFRVYKNDMIFFIFPDNTYKGGKISSFLENKQIASFLNPRFPSLSQYQPDAFCRFDKNKKCGAKQHLLSKAIGIIKLDLDILGNINSLQTIGRVESRLYNLLKSRK